MIHRTVPMAGPLQGKTKTRVIGLGYKPPKSKIDLKWGTISTQQIERDDVEDYTYYQAQFENIVDGSEELKAYIYEATEIPRVDLPMTEGTSYHLAYMHTP